MYVSPYRGRYYQWVRGTTVFAILVQLLIDHTGDVCALLGFFHSQ
jgi:hypothetical protein